MGGKELRTIFGDIEREKKWPHPETLTKLADALEIRVFELFIEYIRKQYKLV